MNMPMKKGKKPGLRDAMAKAGKGGGKIDPRMLQTLMAKMKRGGGAPQGMPMPQQGQGMPMPPMSGRGM